MDAFMVSKSEAVTTDAEESVGPRAEGRIERLVGLPEQSAQHARGLKSVGRTLAADGMRPMNRASASHRVSAQVGALGEVFWRAVAAEMSRR